MFNADYWRDKENRKRLKEEKLALNEGRVNKAIAYLKGFFTTDYKKEARLEIKSKFHTRSQKERRARRKTHHDRMVCIKRAA